VNQQTPNYPISHFLLFVQLSQLIEQTTKNQYFVGPCIPQYFLRADAALLQ